MPLLILQVLDFLPLILLYCLFFQMLKGLKHSHINATGNFGHIYKAWLYFRVLKCTLHVYPNLIKRSSKVHVLSCEGCCSSKSLSVFVWFFFFWKWVFSFTYILIFVSKNLKGFTVKIILLSKKIMCRVFKVAFTMFLVFTVNIFRFGSCLRFAIILWWKLMSACSLNNFRKNRAMYVKVNIFKYLFVFFYVFIE